MVVLDDLRTGGFVTFTVDTTGVVVTPVLVWETRLLSGGLAAESMTRGGLANDGDLK